MIGPYPDFGSPLPADGAVLHPTKAHAAAAC
jgi:hypothetical protein